MSIVLQAIWRLFSAQRANASTKTGSKSQTNFEVERKYRLQPGEYDAVNSRLAALGFTLARRIEMTDQFLPVKVDGEMLRVRDENLGTTRHIKLTIKEWVQIAGGKERAETEGDLTPLTRNFLLFLGRLVRGKALLSFSKLRLDHESPRYARSIVALDTVEGLGANSGQYVEIEVLVPQDGDVETARGQIAALARSLFNEDREPVKQSYMDMLKLVS